MGDSSGSSRARDPGLLLGGGALVIAALALLAHQIAALQGMEAPLGTLGAGLFEEGLWRTLAFVVLGAALGSALFHALAALLDKVAPMPLRSLESLDGTSLRETLNEVRLRTEDALRGSMPDVGHALDEILRGGLLVQASDIHMSPTAAHFTITYRVHGSLHEVVHLAPEFAPRLAVRVKVLARMNTYAREPQDGRLRHQLGDMTLEARVSSLPADYGERLVLRLVRGGRRIPALTQLGFGSEVEEGLRAILTKPQGMLFVSGPVGSGKTTTLYSALETISATRGNLTNLVTLEDPIELELPFATQTQINTRMGMSFAQTLRSVLRQDPNVLMLGEIRDRETAEIATQAGLTGHLILTTIHVDSAAGTFARLIEMDVEPFVVASATAGCLSQRLVRVLCTHCRAERAPDPLVVESLRKLAIELPAATYYEPVGCEFCEGQGYLGRAPVAELLVLTPALRQAVHQRRPTGELHELARSEGMTSLLEDALAKAREGVTSLAEVLRVAG